LATTSRPTRNALLALAVGGFGIGTGEFVTLGLLPNVAASIHVSIPRAGNLVSAYALGVVVGAPLLTAAAVRFTRKRFLIVMALAMALGNFVSALAPNFTTLAIARFLTGLPHGAYFGVATVVAASLVRRSRRSSAMAVVFAGLTISNIVGVPLATLLGQHTSWRLVYTLVGMIQLLAALAVVGFVPMGQAEPEAEHRHIRHELRAFRQPQIWLCLAIATIAGASLFCTFSYITPMMTHVAHYPEGAITGLLVLFGIGMTIGNLVGARLADRALMRTVCFAIAGEAIVAGLFFFGAHDKPASAVLILLFPAFSVGLVPGLQSQIVSLAGGAPNLAAASIQAAFNVANSVGALLGGIVIAAGLGYSSPNLVAAALAVAGLGVALWTAKLAARARATKVPDAVVAKMRLDAAPGSR
jgi:MFS transporter, DHA1 family, inner membrane transport protein